MKTTYFILSFTCAALSLPVHDLPEENNEHQYPTLSQLYNPNTNASENETPFKAEHFNIIYTADNKILKLVIPLNSLTYVDVKVAYETKKVLFIIESNNSDGNIISVYKGGDVTKLIDGNDVTEASAGEDIYIAANDGIYTYKNNKTEKYGTLNDKFINIALINNTDLYALSGDKKLYKITNNGTKAEIVNEVDDAVSMTVDIEGNIHYQNSNNEVFIYNNKVVRKVEGMPNNITNLKLVKAIKKEEGVPILINEDTLCFTNCNETSCTAACSPSTVAHLVPSIAVASQNNIFMALGNSVFEYDAIRLLLEALNVSHTS